MGIAVCSCSLDCQLVTDRYSAVGIYGLVKEAVDERNVMKIQLKKMALKSFLRLLIKVILNEVKMSFLSKFETTSSYFLFGLHLIHC